MVQHLSSAGVTVPDGFATTAHAFRVFLAQNKLDVQISELLDRLDHHDIRALKSAGAQIREKILAQPFYQEFIDAVRRAYATLGANIKVAVRSSATAEDLADASFAGQQQTLLNVVGIENVLTAIKTVYPSLYTDRAITYRNRYGFPHKKVAMSIGIQRMVQSEGYSSSVKWYPLKNLTQYFY